MKFAVITTIILTAISCVQSNNPNEKPQLFSLSQLPLTADSLKGVYSGNFNGSPISIVIHFVSGHHISGYDIHKGLKRNIAGMVSVTGSQLQLDLSEPGTNQYDGRFKIFVDTFSKQIKGWWESLTDKNNVVHFDLKRQVKNEEDYGFILVDSLKNSFTFNNDGSCIYSNLSNDSSNTAQQIAVKGNYTIERDSILTIFWENNNAFPSRKSVFKLHYSGIEEETKLKSITLEDGRVFSELYD